MTHPESPSTLPSGIRLGIACAAMIAVAFGAVAFTEHGSVARLLVMALAVGLVAALIPSWRYATAAGAIGYLVYVGFLVNQYGELSWHERSAAGELVLFGLAFFLGRGQRWIHEGLSALPGELAVPQVELEITAASSQRQNSAVARMDAVKSPPAGEPHRVSF